MERNRRRVGRRMAILRNAQSSSRGRERGAGPSSLANRRFLAPGGPGGPGCAGGGGGGGLLLVRKVGGGVQEGDSAILPYEQYCSELLAVQGLDRPATDAAGDQYYYC